MICSVCGKEAQSGYGYRTGDDMYRLSDEV